MKGLCIVPSLAILAHLLVGLNARVEECKNSEAPLMQRGKLLQDRQTENDTFKREITNLRSTLKNKQEEFAKKEDRINANERCQLKPIKNSDGTTTLGCCLPHQYLDIEDLGHPHCENCAEGRTNRLPNTFLNCYFDVSPNPGSPTPNKTKMDAGDAQQTSADVTAVDQDHNVTAKIAEDGINYSGNSSKDSVVNRTKVEREDSINHKVGLNESNSNSHNENVTFVDRKNGTVTDLPTSDPSGHENDTCALLCVFGISLAILAFTVLIVVVAIKWKPAKGFRHRYSEQKYMPPVWSLAEAVRECDKNMRINETTNIY